MKMFWLAVLLLGDLIVLKNGETIEGVYVGEDDQSVRYRDASGQMHVQPKSAVQRVERTRTKSNVYEDIASALSGERREDYYYLCVWAEEQGLKPAVDKLCKIAVSDENLRGRAFFKLGGVAGGDQARVSFRRAAVSDPTLVEAVKALQASGEEVPLPFSFLSSFTKALNDALTGRYRSGLSRSRLALAELGVAQRRKADARFKLETRMTLDAYLSCLDRMSTRGRKAVCTFCKGKGYFICNKCGGNGWVACSGCGGKGYRKKTITDGVRRHEELHACPTCKSTGRVDCRLCSRLSTPVQDEYIVMLPPTPRKYVRLPAIRLETARSSFASGGTVIDGRITRTMGTTVGSITGLRANYTRRYSGRRPCARCRQAKEPAAKSFTIEELERLGRIARMWKSELARSGGVWGEGTKLCGFEELDANLRVEPERSTAFYQGKWITPSMRRMYLSAGGQKKDGGAVPQFEEWKPGYKARMVAEHAIEIPADPRAWRGLLGLYALSANSPEKRFGARQIFYATFRAGGGEASVISPDGVFLASTDPELTLELDTPLETGGAGEVDLWFRVSGARGGRGSALSVTVLAARLRGKTTAFF